MAHRTPTIGGNWKMNLHLQEALSLAAGLADAVVDPAAQVTVFPAFPYLAAVASVLADKRSPIQVGAQDAYPRANGAYTGEVSLSMLKDVGCSVVLAGHSERRHIVGEPDALINEKVHAALDAGLEVVLAIGETIQQRDAGMTDFVNYGQICLGLAGVTADQMARVTLAYEPVWAIGTGKTATPADAQAAHAAIRGCLKGIYNEQVAEAVRIQYGGSMKPGNAADLLAQPDIDGGLIGGASLKTEDFAAIVDAAAAGVAAS